MPFSYLNDELHTLEDQGLLRRRRLVESAQGASIQVDGSAYLSFCSNDYLGLANHPALTAAAHAGATQYGVGSGASHLITGHALPHHLLEQALAMLVGQPEALLFSTGYMANMGVVSALVGRNDTVFVDKLNHASLNDAVLVSRAKMQRYPHLDMARLETLLANCKQGRKLVVTDAVFSMDGDMAPLPELVKLCERYDAWLLLDDAHGFGVLGAEGQGILAHFNVQSPRIIYMATLGKAAGVFGAFVAGAPAMIQTLVQRARTYIYTTAMPPMLASSLLASVELIRQEDWRRQQLQTLIQYLKLNLKLTRWQLMQSDTPIQPIIIGANQETLAVSEALRQRGILVPAIRPPTVPKGEARLRISLSAAHSIEDVRGLVSALHELEQNDAIPG